MASVQNLDSNRAHALKALAYSLVDSSKATFSDLLQQSVGIVEHSFHGGPWFLQHLNFTVFGTISQTSAPSFAGANS
jgi:hypothetical protein